MSARLRPDLDTIAAYKPGRRPAVGQSAVRLASNETSFGPLPGVAEAVAAATAESHRYPDPTAARLVEALAATHGVGPDQVSVGTGSVAVVQSLLLAVAAPGDEVVYAWRSFEAYPVMTRVTGATPVQVPLLPTAEHDLEAMLAAVTDRTRAVLLCTPNNPTGPALRQADVEAFLARVPGHVLVVLDEAYAEFVDDPEAVDGRTLLDRHPSLVVTRTFSKAYGLAGLRVGYALSAPDVAVGVRKVTVPFSVSAPAQAAAVASLAATDALAERCAVVRAERDRAAGALRAEGFDVPATQGNFVWLPLGARSEEAEAVFEQESVLVRRYGDEGLRVTVTDREETDRMLDAARKVRSTLG